MIDHIGWIYSVHVVYNVYTGRFALEIHMLFHCGIVIPDDSNVSYSTATFVLLNS